MLRFKQKLGRWYIDVVYSSPAMKMICGLVLEHFSRVLSDIGSYDVGGGLKVRNESFWCLVVEGQPVRMMWCLWCRLPWDSLEIRTRWHERCLFPNECASVESWWTGIGVVKLITFKRCVLYKLICVYSPSCRSKPMICCYLTCSNFQAAIFHSVEKYSKPSEDIR